MNLALVSWVKQIINLKYQHTFMQVAYFLVYGDVLKKILEQKHSRPLLLPVKPSKSIKAILNS